MTVIKAPIHTSCTLTEPVENCLKQHGLHADVHLILSHYGLRKRYGEDCTLAQSDELFEGIRQLIASDARQHGSRQ